MCPLALNHDHLGIKIHTVLSERVTILLPSTGYTRNILYMCTYNKPFLSFSLSRHALCRRFEFARLSQRAARACARNARQLRSVARQFFPPISKIFVPLRSQLWAARVLRGLTTLQGYNRFAEGQGRRSFTHLTLGSYPDSFEIPSSDPLVVYTHTRYDAIGEQSLTFRWNINFRRFFAVMSGE